MDDTLRLDLADYGKEYISEVLSTFLENAYRHGRKLVEIRMSKAMLDTLAIAPDPRSFRDVPITVCNTGFEGTIEVVFAPQH